ncbi:MAG: hypothetical protein AB7I27_18540 [Bacteriovoracaceae bacterium]
MSCFYPQLPANFKKLLSFDLEEIERGVIDKEGHYFGLDERALYTSLDDLFVIQSHPLIHGTWVDLGAGVGKSVLLYALLFPERHSIGVEFSEARSSAGMKFRDQLNLMNAEMISADLLSCEIPYGDIYFLYFPTGPVLDRILFELSKRNHFRLIVIESHGDLINRIDRELWLKKVGEIKLESQRHYPNAVIYESLGPLKLSSGPFQLSFLQNYLFIEDTQGIWLGESFGLEWLQEQYFQLKFPPRTINWAEVKEIKCKENLNSLEMFLIMLRRYEFLEILTEEEKLLGSIRKIYVSPTFSLDLSIGKKVEWSSIKSIHWGNHLCYESSSDFYFLPLAH